MPPKDSTVRELTIQERVTASRAAQGLPPVVTDPAVIERVAAILLAAETATANRDNERSAA